MNISHQTYFCSGFWPFIYRLDFIIIFAGSRSRCLIERYCINFCQHAKKMSGSDSVRFSIAHLTFQFMCQLNTFERTAFPINSHLKLERTIQAHSQEYQYTMQAKQIDAIHVAIPKCVFDLCEPIICTLHNAHNRTEQNRTEPNIKMCNNHTTIRSQTMPVFKPYHFQNNDEQANQNKGCTHTRKVNAAHKRYATLHIVVITVSLSNCSYSMTRLLLLF